MYQAIKIYMNISDSLDQYAARIYGATVIYQYRAAIYSLFSEILSYPLHTDFSEKDG